MGDQVEKVKPEERVTRKKPKNLQVRNIWIIFRGSNESEIRLSSIYLKDRQERSQEDREEKRKIDIFKTNCEIDERKD